MEGDRLLTLTQAAEVLHVSRATILRRIADGSLPVVDLAPPQSERGTWRVRLSDLNTYVDERRVVVQ